MIPQATEQTFTPDMQYCLSNALFIHTLMKTPTIFLLAMSLYLLPLFGSFCWMLARPLIGVEGRLLTETLLSD